MASHIHIHGTDATDATAVGGTLQFPLLPSLLNLDFRTVLYQSVLVKGQRDCVNTWGSMLCEVKLAVHP